MYLKKNIVFVLVGALIVVLSSCWSGKKAADKKVGLLKGLVLVNVLDKDFFDDCHIKGSINIPFMEVKDADKKIDKDAEIVAYCSNYMCTASSSARTQLMDMGYKKVYVYEGGTAEWLQKGYPVTGPSKKGYLKMEMPKPAGEEKKYMLSAEELKKKMEENKIL